MAYYLNNSSALMFNSYVSLCGGNINLLLSISGIAIGYKI